MLRNIGYLFFVVVFALGTYLFLTDGQRQQLAKESPPVEYQVKQYSNNDQTAFEHAPTRVTPRAYGDDSGAVLVQLPAQAEDGDVIVIEPAPSGGIVNWVTWFYRNFQVFAAIFLGLLVAIEPIIRWTPTEKDNNLLRIIQSWLDKVAPNRRTGGGTFTAFSDPKDAPKAAYVKRE